MPGTPIFANNAQRGGPPLESPCRVLSLVLSFASKERTSPLGGGSPTTRAGVGASAPAGDCLQQSGRTSVQAWCFPQDSHHAIHTTVPVRPNSESPLSPPAPTSESVSIPHDAKNAPVKRYASPMPFTHSSPLPFLYFQNKETPPFHGRQRSFEPIVLYNAFFGQALAHSKHRMHSVPFFRLRELSVISTSMGHTFLHFPQETHLLWSH